MNFLGISARGKCHFFPKRLSEGHCSHALCPVFRGFLWEKAPGKEDLSASCGRQGVGSTLSLPAAVQQDTIPCAAVWPSQGTAGFQLLLPVIRNSPKSQARLILVTLHLQEEQEPSQHRSIPGALVGMNE